MASLMEALAKAACTSARKAKSYTDEKISKVNENFAASAGMVEGLEGYSMRGSKSGSEITIDDMRDLPSKVRVKAKIGTDDEDSLVNLIPWPYFDISKESNGITYTVNTDGRIFAKGISTGVSTFYIAKSNNAITPFEKDKYYTIFKANIGGVIFYTTQFKEGVSNSQLWINRTDGASSQLASNAIGYEIYIVVPKDTDLGDGVTFEPMIVEGQNVKISAYVPPIGADGTSSADVTITTASVTDPSIEGESITTQIGETVEFDPIMPAMKITTNREDVTIKAAYNRKIDKVIEKITDAFIRLGGNV